MSNLKPIKLYSHKGGPNPWKNAIIFEELGIPYEQEFLEFDTVKADKFLAINPNGRVPAIEDPNTGMTLWESGAIAEYTVATYDKENKISYASSPEKWHTMQWGAFQISGQGPYYGQAMWFLRYHPENVPSAFERYVKEMERIIGVIDLHLSKTGKKFLVGDKCTYADLMFLTWATAVPVIDSDNKIFGAGKYPKYQEWMKTLNERPAVKKVMAERAKSMSG